MFVLRVIHGDRNLESSFERRWRPAAQTYDPCFQSISGWLTTRESMAMSFLIWPYLPELDFGGVRSNLLRAGFWPM